MIIEYWNLSVPPASNGQKSPNEEAAEYIRAELMGLLGKDPRIIHILDMLPDAAASDAPILLQGERFTGKALLASTIHRLSRMAKRPFISLDCRGLSEPEAMARLIGDSAAHLGWVQEAERGCLKRAKGGTLFIRGIDSCPLSVQTLLLSAIETGKERTEGPTLRGSSSLRIIASAEEPLEQKLRAGLFKESLFYTLRVFQFDLPALRERSEDIRFLADQHLKRLNRLKGEDVERFNASALDLLCSYDYPENLKELEEIVALCHEAAEGTSIGPLQLPTRVYQRALRRKMMKAVTETVRAIIFYADFSQESDRALSFALEQAKRTGARLDVVHILHSRYRFHGEIVDGFITRGMMMGLNPEILQKSLKILKSRYEHICSGYNNVRFHVLSGVASVELLRFARKNGAELLVLGREAAEMKESGETAPLWKALSRKAPCPVAILASLPEIGRRKKADIPKPKVSPTARKVIPLCDYLEKRRSPAGNPFPS